MTRREPRCSYDRPLRPMLLVPVLAIGCWALIWFVFKLIHG